MADDPPVNLHSLIPAGELKRQQTEVIEEIERVLGDSVRILKEENIDATFEYFTNRDGSIDAELRIRTIPRFKTFSQVVTAVEETLEPIENTWVSSGVLFSERVDDRPYDKLQGYNRASSYYQPASKFHYNLATSREIVKGLRKAGRGAVHQFFYRIHWNGMVEKPERDR